MAGGDGEAPHGSPVLDIAFLDRQTFGDTQLLREILAMFLTQAASLVPGLPDMAGPQQTEKAHLLKGSCQGIGAVAAADLLQRYGDADKAGRLAMQPQIEAVFTRTAAAIEGRLAAT